MEWRHELLRELMGSQARLEASGIPALITEGERTDQELDAIWERKSKLPMRNLYVRQTMHEPWTEVPGGEWKVIRMNLEHVEELKYREGWDTMVAPPGLSSEQVEELWASRN
jgi:hypothetical protein